MNYESLRWDDDWTEIISPYHEAQEEFHANMGDMPNHEFSKLEAKLGRAEAKYKKFYLDSAECRFYAERLIANLADKNPKHQFAAHTDPFAYSPNTYWRVLVRSATGKAITSQAFQELKESAKAILRNVERKYPGEGEEAREEAEKAHEAMLKTRKLKEKFRPRF